MENEKVFRLKKGMRWFCWVMGGLCIPLIVTLPGTVLMFMLATRARFVARPDGFAFTWIRTHEASWDDVTNLEWGSRGSGIAGITSEGKYPAGILVTRTGRES